MSVVNLNLPPPRQPINPGIWREHLLRVLAQANLYFDEDEMYEILNDEYRKFLKRRNKPIPIRRPEAG
jgi:hypothetical protein